MEECYQAVHDMEVPAKNEPCCFKIIMMDILTKVTTHIWSKYNYNLLQSASVFCCVLSFQNDSVQDF